MNDIISVEHLTLIDLLTKILGEYRKHSEGKMELTYNCPVCLQLKISEGLLPENADADYKYNLEVNYRKGIYNCWSCGKTHKTHGTIKNLVAKFGSQNDLNIYNSLGLNYDYIHDEDSESQPDTQLWLPKEFIFLTGKRATKVYKKAFDYLDGRGITDDIIQKFRIGWCYDGDFEDRILIPSIFKSENDDGEEREKVDYFVSRTFDSFRKPKYLNCDRPKELMVFNESLINWNKTVFVVEGPFDHIVTPNSLPMLGKRLYPLLQSTIYEKANNNVVVLTDPDAQGDGVNIYRQLDGGRLLGKVFINFLPKYYDPAKFFEKFGWEAYKNQLRKNIRLVD